MDISGFFVHSATVETFTGSGPTGDVYAAPVAVKGWLDDGVVRVQTDHGITLEQQSKWYGPLADAATFTPGSIITVNGRTVVVDHVRRRDAGGLPLPEHLEVALR